MTRAYYNEHDKKAAAWLRELIRGGHIADGDVDERSITEIKPEELKHYAQCHFFAGIGGWSLALRLAGWPDDVPVWTGSCPCQPFSNAGAGRGTADERHLWPVFARLIGECSPSTVFGEQVASKAGRDWLAGVFADLEGMGYQRAGADLCAAGVGAPHIRQRLYWMAYSDGEQCDEGLQPIPRGSSERDGSDCESHGSGGGLADVLSEGQQGRLRGREDSRREDQHGHVGRDGAVSGLGEPDGAGRREGQSSTAPAGHGDPAQSASGGFWTPSEFIPCRDGKARRTQPGLFTLAHGVSGRVGLLRGYGNAIVPPLAAEFISACTEAIADSRETIRTIIPTTTTT